MTRSPLPAASHESQQAELGPGSPGSPQKTRIRFVDKTAETGIRFTYRNDEEHSPFSILESLGGGVAVLDFDGDGNLDLFIPGGGQFGDRVTSGCDSALYRNLSTWRFENVTLPARVGRSDYYSHGASVADFNEDGFDDVLVTGYGGLTLYQNQGDGTFQQRVGSGLDNKLWSTSAAWGDFNRDGSLDLYVAHYVNWSFENNPVCEGTQGHPRDVCSPRHFEGSPHSIFVGQGDGTFRDGTSESGIHPNSKGLGVVVADVDLDGDLDIYVSNDTVLNYLFQNDGHGRFEDVSLTSGTAFSDRGTPDGSMGVDVGDYNNDGLPDIWVTNYERETNALYKNVGHGLFRHVSQSTGIAAVGANYVGWGTRFVDADLDGDEDLIVTNGHVIRFPENSPRLQRPLMLENRDGIRFLNVADDAGDYMQREHCGRGLATGDLDGDGDEDVVISHVIEPVAVLSNEHKDNHNWLGVRIIGRESCRSAIGAWINVRIGDRRVMRQIRGGSSYGSTSEYRLHLGCALATKVDELTVKWISGMTSTLKDVECNRVVIIIETEESSL